MAQVVIVAEIEWGRVRIEMFVLPLKIDHMLRTRLFSVKVFNRSY